MDSPSSSSSPTPPATPPTLPRPPISWKRNLAVLWVAQVVTTLGFSFTFPFFPIFFQELGIAEVERAAFWSGASGWVFGLGMLLFAPVWGIIGDRYGRKLNIVRAMVLGGIILVLAGYSQTPMQLLVSRFFVGVTSGVVPTILALVATQTPRDRIAFATGATMGALFFGTALGPLFGGIIFDNFGMRASFWATGLALGAAAMMVVVLVREDFRRPQMAGRTAEGDPPGSPLRAFARTGRAVGRPFADFWRMATARTFVPLLLVVLFVHVAHLVIMPALPGIVERLHQGEGTATAAGVVFMFIGVGSASSSMLMGWIAGRAGLRRVFIAAAALAAAANLGPFVANSLALFTAAVFSLSLVSGGLAGLASGMIAMRAPRERQGAAFGASQAAVSVGIAMGPLAGGAAAVAFGLRSVFLVNAGVFLTILLLAVVVLQVRSDE